MAAVEVPHIDMTNRNMNHTGKSEPTLFQIQHPCSARAVMLCHVGHFNRPYIYLLRFTFLRNIQTPVDAHHQALQILTHLSACWTLFFVADIAAYTQRTVCTDRHKANNHIIQ